MQITASRITTPSKKRSPKPAPRERKGSAFTIEVRFLGGLSPSQENAFQTAARRWAQIIVGDLPAVELPTGETVDDVLIDARDAVIDGPSGILGQAGPTHLRPNTFLPCKGIMEFDTADLSRMEADGSLVDVIIHEMGHVLGIGTIWQLLELLEGAGTANPVFLGESAQNEFAALLGRDDPVPVPVANTGGAGTRDGHWRESVLGIELMTGFINRGDNPLSRLSAAALEDMGYEVNIDAADPFSLSDARELALMGIGALEHPQGCCMCGTRTRGVDYVVLPEEALVN